MWFQKNEICEKKSFHAVEMELHLSRILLEGIVRYIPEALPILLPRRFVGGLARSSPRRDSLPVARELRLSL